MKNAILFIVLLLSSIYGCKSNENEAKPSINDNKNFVIDNWQSLNNQYSQKAIIMLDPHGEASACMAHYKDLSGNNRTALYASSSIYNGQPVETVNSLLDSLIKHLQTKNPSIEIRLAGFSGGAKYAMEYASTHNVIKGLILCGAVSTTNIGLMPTLLFCGQYDMNYASMMLYQANNGHHIVWAGIHSWPDAKVFSLAFEPTANWTKNAHIVSTTEEAELRQELSLQQTYMQQYGSFTDNDWTRIVQHLSDDKSNLVSARCKAVLSMNSYFYTDHFIKNGQYENAMIFCRRYLSVDPNNADAYYFKALIELKQGHKSEAQSDFKKATQLGWHETADKKKDAAFNF